MAQMDYDETALLIAEHGANEDNMMLLDEEKIMPKLNTSKNDKANESNVWYLDNGARNHMTGQRLKFRTLDESIT